MANGFLYNKEVNRQRCHGCGLKGDCCWTFDSRFIDNVHYCDDCYLKTNQMALFFGHETTNDIDKCRNVSLISRLATTTSKNDCRFVPEKTMKTEKTGLVLSSWNQTRETKAAYSLKESEVIERLGCSLRTLQRYRETGYKDFYLSVMKKQVTGQSLDQNFYSMSEILKIEELRKEQNVKPAIVKAETITKDDFYNFASMIKEVLDVQNKQLQLVGTTEKKAMSIANIASKLLINLNEATTYSGLSPTEIKTALEAHTILGKKTSDKGVWKINRKSLDNYVSVNYG